MKQFLLLGLGFVIVTYVACLPTFGGIAPNLYAIGAADGKTYFADDNNKNWTEAGKFCRGMGMQLASAETPNQLNLWISSHNVEHFNWIYWTAGREAQSFEQFRWNTTGDVVPSNIPIEWENVAYALAFAPFSGNNSVFGQLRVSEEVGVLCELKA